MELHGLLSALSTPFAPGGDEVDESVLRDLVERTVAGGVHGLIPNGSTGEFTTLSHDERRRVTEIVIDQAGGRVPVIPQIGALTIKETVALAKHAEQAGAAAVMAVSPFYEPLDVEETCDFFRKVAGALSIPMMIYNIPVATGVNLLPAQVAGLAREVDQIQYVKDTSFDFSQASELIHEYGDVVKTFVGMDTLYFATLLVGGAGAVNGAANLITPELVAIYDAVQAGDLPGARAKWDLVYPIMKFLTSGPYAQGVKGASAIAGHPLGEPRAPLHPMDEERRDEIESALKRLAAVG